VSAPDLVLLLLLLLLPKAPHTALGPTGWE
jgi:hypothetical protein